MPIRLLSLPFDDLAYTLNCMDIGDLIAFSFCSKQTKKLVRDSKIPIEPINAEVYQNYIYLDIRPRNFRGVQDDPDTVIIRLYFSNTSITLYQKNAIEDWIEDGFTQSDWVAHLLNTFNKSMIRELTISGCCRISYLDTVEQIIPKFQKLHITGNCSTELTKVAFRKLIPNADGVKIVKDRVDNDIHVSQFLKPNLTSVCLSNRGNPFKLELDDLLLANSTFITISSANITEKDLNRFVKLWMKSNHRFYRPEHIDLSFRDEINCEEVLRGVKYQVVDNKHRLKREDGKELEIFVRTHFVAFKFQ
ncbi:unnamed protein product [Caenorhabditis nigoni]